MSRNVDKIIKDNFLNKPPLWRIEAVIHDGAWYTIKKWAKQAKVSEAEIEKYIEENSFVIQGQTLDSYRVSKDSILNWYKKNNINLEERIVPKNYPPKIWAGMTESEAFGNAPRRLATYLLVEIIDTNTVEKMREIFKGKATVSTSAENKCKIYGLSGLYLKNILANAVSEREFKRLKVRIQTQLLRELSDFPQEFIDNFTSFYLEFAKIVLKGHQSTIDLFLPEKDDQNAQIYDWIWRALKKYDNTKCVPFSGYLTNVLSRWPYDLPNAFLGKDLAVFQRKRKLALKELLEERYSRGEISNTLIAQKMNIPIKEFLVMLEQHQLWDKSKNTEEYNFKETNNEKEASNIWSKEQVSRNYELLHKLSLAAIKATVNTKLYQDGERLIKIIDLDDVNLNGISNKFIQEYRKQLEVLLNEK